MSHDKQSVVKAESKKKVEYVVRIINNRAQYSRRIEGGISQLIDCQSVKSVHIFVSRLVGAIFEWSFHSLFYFIIQQRSFRRWYERACMLMLLIELVFSPCVSSLQPLYMERARKKCAHFDHSHLRQQAQTYINKSHSLTSKCHLDAAAATAAASVFNVLFAVRYIAQRY